MSYGSYIYQWQSKFQYIYWPLTDGAVLYSCKKCRLTCYMWDYEQIPAEKFAEIKKRLEGVTFASTATEYTKIPMSQRLRAAEVVYSVLKKDDEFWCQFYRVMGYHFENENNRNEADEARKQALRMAEGLSEQKDQAGRRKEFLLISGAMKYFLRDPQRALEDFKKALKLQFEDAKLEKEKATNFDKYLTELLTEYVKKIENEELKKGSGQNR